MDMVAGPQCGDRLVSLDVLAWMPSVLRSLQLVEAVEASANHYQSTLCKPQCRLVYDRCVCV